MDCFIRRRDDSPHTRLSLVPKLGAFSEARRFPVRSVIVLINLTWLLSPEPVVVEVSPDPSASTMTGGAESSSLSGTLA
jgi:hypothetical protein